MRSVNVNVEELLETVKKNREVHVSEYAEAVKGYKREAAREVEKAMDRMKRRIEELEAGEVIHLGAVHFDLAVPENHAKDYDQVIKMLEMSVDETIELKSDEFACYVMDDWGWKNDWSATNRSYIGK